MAYRYALDALDHNGSVPVILDELHAVPIPEEPRADFRRPREPHDARAEFVLVVGCELRIERCGIVREGRRVGCALLGLQAKSLREHGIGGADLAAVAVVEGQGRILQVGRAPGEDVGVERDDEGGEAARLGPFEEGKADLGRAGPGRIG